MFEQSLIPPDKLPRNFLVGVFLIFTLLVLTAMSLFLAESLSSPPRIAFDPVKWKSADQYERARMADDFLKTNNTIGMTVAQIKELLGQQDHEDDKWMYNLSLNGAPPDGPWTADRFQKHPRLCVCFKDTVVNVLEFCGGPTDLDPQVTNELRFQSDLWKASNAAIRVKMIGSLKSSNAFKGLSKDEVRKRLGEPDAKSQSRDIEYYLGYRMIDLATLTFEIDRDGRVTNAERVEH